MDIMIAYFPMIKGIFAILLFGGFIYFIKTKRYKVAGWYLFLLILTAWYSPIKYDGTKTISHHKEQAREMTKLYDDITDEKIITHKETFAEKMEEEETRSEKANNKIKKEIVE